MTRAIAFILLTLAACRTDGAQCERYEFGGATYCMVKNPVLIEEGFECPPDMPNWIPTDGGGVCAPDGRTEDAERAWEEYSGDGDEEWAAEPDEPEDDPPDDPPDMEVPPDELAPRPPTALDPSLTQFEQVLQILRANCDECHGRHGDLVQLMPDWAFLAPSREEAIADLLIWDNRFVTPGNPDDSNLIIRLEGRDEPRMPLEQAPLATEDIDFLRSWIAAGAPVEISEPPQGTVTQVDPNAWPFCYDLVRHTSDQVIAGTTAAGGTAYAFGWRTGSNSTVEVTSFDSAQLKLQLFDRACVPLGESPVFSGPATWQPDLDPGLYTIVVLAPSPSDFTLRISSDPDVTAERHSRWIPEDRMTGGWSGVCDGVPASEIETRADSEFCQGGMGLGTIVEHTGALPDGSGFEWTSSYQVRLPFCSDAQAHLISGEGARVILFDVDDGITDVTIDRVASDTCVNCQPGTVLVRPDTWSGVQWSDVGESVDLWVVTATGTGFGTFAGEGLSRLPGQWLSPESSCQ